jgi:predicted transcriptional regulator of viral defense system
MTYLEFREPLLPFQVFSIRDVEKYFPDFDSRRLVEWQRKGYIRKLINKWYLFSECLVDELLMYRISNCIYRPSYISLESALAYYHLIPEAVYSQKAITTRKTKSYTPSVGGTFDYHSIKPGLFFGFTIIRKGSLPIMIAELEKAILDYFYLNTSLKTAMDIEQLRLNYPELHNILDWEKLGIYQQAFSSKVLDKRIMELTKLLQHADTI